MTSQCFLDEFGNNGFDFSKPGVSSHFIICGIILSESNLAKMQLLSDSISKKYFGGSEIKSRKIGSDDKKRISVIKELLDAPFHIYLMVFDKQEMYGKGLHQKKSFYKFLNRLAYQNLTQALGDTKIVADELGGKEFMNSFGTYISKQLSNIDLFGTSIFEFVQSSSSRFVQLADFFAGTIARCFDKFVLSPRKEAILSLIIKSERLLPIFEWPERRRRYSSTELIGLSDSLDSDIFRLSLRKARTFIANNSVVNSNFIPEQVAAVKVLLHQVLYGNPKSYISTGKFLNYFSVNPKLKVSKKQFGRSVIGPLRDATVLISSNKVGYKLVVDVADLRQFVKYYHLFIEPMLHRMKKYRDAVLLSTRRRLDIIDLREYNYLKKYFDT